jgi:hypothetical protein
MIGQPPPSRFSESKERSAATAGSSVVSLGVSESVRGLIVLTVVAGFYALVLVLLNARDRRRDRAVAHVLGACERSLRSQVALQVRASLLSRRTVAVLDMSDCRGAVWSTMRRLADVLPPDVALVIVTRLDGALPVTVTMRRPAASNLCACR